MRVNSTVRINNARLRQLNAAAVRALEKTGEYLHTEVVQAQVIPFDDPEVVEKRVYGKRGRYKKDGSEYKGKIVKETVHGGGHLQNDSTFVDYSNAGKGKVSLVHSTPYARRLYYHPEFNFDKGENPNAKGKWYEDWLPGGKKEKDCANAFKEFYRQEGGL